MVNCKGRITALLAISTMLAVCGFIIFNLFLKENLLGYEEAVSSGMEVLFKDLSLGCFYNESGKNLLELQYKRGEGAFGWNVPDDRCSFGGIKDFVEDWRIDNSILVKFEGSKVSIKVGMDFLGDQLKLAIVNPDTKTELDAGYINTCANKELAEIYPPDRHPNALIENPNELGRKFSPAGRYVQEFMVAENLPYGTYFLKIVHSWDKDKDPGRDDYNHLYSMKVK